MKEKEKKEDTTSHQWFILRTFFFYNIFLVFMLWSLFSIGFYNWSASIEMDIRITNISSEIGQQYNKEQMLGIALNFFSL